MDNLISLEKFIELAKHKGIDFGKGDPYNRLRYYTKMGWLPHMVRKKDENGDIKGHYPEWALERLLEIEKLKSSDLPNTEIAKKVKTFNRLETLITLFKSKENRNQLILYTTLAFITIILLNEARVIKLGKPTATLLDQSQYQIPNIIVESGVSFVPKNRKSIFVETQNISSTSKVYAAFHSDYSPATRFWIANIEQSQGFLLELDSPVFDNAEFNWWISN